MNIHVASISTKVKIKEHCVPNASSFTRNGHILAPDMINLKFIQNNNINANLYIKVKSNKEKERKNLLVMHRHFLQGRLHARTHLQSALQAQSLLNSVHSHQLESLPASSNPQ
jgi:hypothetical protein